MGTGMGWDCSVGVLCNFGGNNHYEATGGLTQGCGAQASLGILFNYGGNNVYDGLRAGLRHRRASPTTTCPTAAATSASSSITAATTRMAAGPTTTTSPSGEPPAASSSIARALRTRPRGGKAKQQDGRDVTCAAKDSVSQGCGLISGWHWRLASVRCKHWRDASATRNQ